MIEENIEFINNTKEEFKFFTFVYFNDNKTTFGVVQNDTPKVLMFYDFLKLKNEDDKKEFIKFCEFWWYQSGQTLPINIFIGREFDKFNYILCGYTKKSFVKEPEGPIFSLNNIYLKKAKKKRIDLIAIRNN